MVCSWLGRTSEDLRSATSSISVAGARVAARCCNVRSLGRQSRYFGLCDWEVATVHGQKEMGKDGHEGAE